MQLWSKIAGHLNYVNLLSTFSNFVQKIVKVMDMKEFLFRLEGKKNTVCCSACLNHKEWPRKVSYKYFNVGH